MAYTQPEGIIPLNTSSTHPEGQPKPDVSFFQSSGLSPQRKNFSEEIGEIPQISDPVQVTEHTLGDAISAPKARPDATPAYPANLTARPVKVEDEVSPVETAKSKPHKSNVKRNLALGGVTLALVGAAADVAYNSTENSRAEYAAEQSLANPSGTAYSKIESGLIPAREISVVTLKEGEGVVSATKEVEASTADVGVVESDISTEEGGSSVITDPTIALATDDVKKTVLKAQPDGGKVTTDALVALETGQSVKTVEDVPKP